MFDIYQRQRTKNNNPIKNENTNAMSAIASIITSDSIFQIEVNLFTF